MDKRIIFIGEIKAITRAPQIEPKESIFLSHF